MTSLIDVEGIGKSYARKLSGAGIKTTEALLKQGSTPKGRKAISEKSGVSSKQILRWVNMADLFRIKGIGEEYSDLLEACGVDTVVELAQRNTGNLNQALAKENSKRKLVRALPGEKRVASWVKQAKKLPRVVSY
jgi:predicted flap endonuclease-1-like 5' DNA nuclease